MTHRGMINKAAVVMETTYGVVKHLAVVRRNGKNVFPPVSLGTGDSKHTSWEVTYKRKDGLVVRLVAWVQLPQTSFMTLAKSFSLSGPDPQKVFSHLTPIGFTRVLEDKCKNLRCSDTTVI